MPPIYVKPENALKRSEELLALGTAQSQQQAFENLWEVFQSKRFKHTSNTILEPIVIKFIDLCVANSRKSHARLALLTYKNAVQSTSVSSIETVLNHFIAAAESRLNDAIEQAKKEVSALPEAPVDDELPLQPSAMLFDSFIDQAGDRERIERRLIAPAQKFCWDAYDISLDVAKGNDRLELIYQSIAHRAFNFCVTHQRKTDFRRLCEQRLRKDISNAAKYGHQQHAINLSDPETLSRHLDTRFLQLETAVGLELWQEAFRSVEDVYLLLQGKKARPAMMANYYEKLTQIFKAEGGKQTAVFHAAAWAHYYHYSERSGSIQMKAPGCVLLSALAVPYGHVETKQRLVSLLNLQAMPTRDELVKDAAGRHLKRVSPEIRQIYNIIEVDFQPITAAKRLAPLIAALGPDFAPYLPALKEVVFSKLVRELSQFYDSISLQSILEFVKPFDGTPWATDIAALEKFLISFARETNIPARVDHVAKSITFTADTTDLNKLSNLAICLHTAVNYLNPAALPSRAEVFAKAIEQAEEERKAIAHRRQIVTKRRELMEEANLRREREESTAKAERAKQAAEEAARREREAAKAAELAALQKQMEATRREEAQKLAQTLAAKGDLKVDISSIEDLDSTKLVAMQVEQLAKEKRELNERLRIVAKRVDHLERAFRKEERPLLAEDYERQKKEDREAHDRANALAREQAIEQQKASIELKKRLGRMMPDYLVARQAVESQQQQEFQAARAAASKKIEEEKAKFKASVIARRQAEKEREEQERAEAEERERVERERAEQEARLAEERAAEQARIKAEAEAKEAEEAERKAKAKAERDAERARLDEQARKQREREEEAERRRLERASGGGLRRTEPASNPSSLPPTAVKAGSWRDRLAARQAGGETAAPAASSTPPASTTPEPAAAEAPSGAYRPGQGKWSARGRGGGASGAPSTRGTSRW
ncbi:hypothetical protein DB88DRAFT_507347 [Papiliotrema laurentii]|uniref:Eukaryotic translation initiation factor 3 subunit A n=1 Tax=Papiliotrema laurentii TaxID=5418 RepID=A0AAD9FWD8_PAPLA|nr:hypothetical protein DB88DRAFT_507347 [Papiliotrema laurentii]